MNNLLEDIDNFFYGYKNYQSTIDFNTKQVLIAPVSIYFGYIQNFIKKENLNIKLGIQNCYFEEKGAFTGEISPLMLKDLKVDFVIIGHSERRHIFKESNEIINKKTQICLKSDITTIFCIGETLEQRETKNTFKVLENQLKIGLNNITNCKKLIIAYEPVWAIGTGKTATITQIQEVHFWLKNFLEKNIANNIPLLYGGSVKPSNITEIMNVNYVDGVLVGGASLKIEDFIKIINFEKEC